MIHNPQTDPLLFFIIFAYFLHLIGGRVLSRYVLSKEMLFKPSDFFAMCNVHISFYILMFDWLNDIKWCDGVKWYEPCVKVTTMVDIESHGYITYFKNNFNVFLNITQNYSWNYWSKQNTAGSILFHIVSRISILLFIIL